MDKVKWRFKTSIVTFIAAAIGLLGLALGFSYDLAGHAEIMILSLSLVIIFLLFANTLLLYAIVYELDNVEGGDGNEK
ncbi:MAG: hypothetical protein AB1797_07690 [bacterium]